MQRRDFTAGAFLSLAGAGSAFGQAAAGAAPAGSWRPARPLKLVLPNAPGGASDVLARSIQGVMQQVLGQPIVIESKPGASGNIALEYVAKAPPDGYTLFLSTVVAAINPFLFTSSKVRPDRDLRGISTVAITPTVLVANPNFAASSVPEFIALAKRGEIAYASSGTGAITTIQMERFARDNGIKLLQIPYKGGAGAAIVDVVGGQVPLQLTSMPSVLELLKGRKLKALAVTSTSRQPLLPDVPTMAEQGYRQPMSQQWQALFAPAGTPQEVVDSLYAALVTALKDDKVRRTMAEVGQVPEISASPKAMDEFLVAEMKSWGTIIGDLGIKGE